MIDLFGVLFWPLILLGASVFALFYYKRVPERWARPLGYTAVTLTTLPIFALFFFLYDGSQLIIFDQWTIFIAMGFLVLWGWPIFESSRPRSKIVLAIFAISAISFGSWHLVGDFLFSKHEAEGFVENKTISRGMGRTFYVFIDGRRYKTTGDLFDSLAIGAHVRVEYGVGSDTIFRVESAS